MLRTRPSANGAHVVWWPFFSGAAPLERGGAPLRMLAALLAAVPLLLTANGVTSVAPADGEALWTHGWPVSSRTVQAALSARGIC